VSKFLTFSTLLRNRLSHLLKKFCITYYTRIEDVASSFGFGHGGLTRIGPAFAYEKRAIPAIKTMKSIKYLLAVAAITGALTLSAQADLLFKGAIDFGNGPNDPGTNHDALEAFLGFDPGTLNHNYEGPDSGGSTDFSQSLAVFPGEYFIVHYGKGNDGTGNGGSWEIFQVINGETSVNFPLLGNGPDNPDPYGHGGISSARGFGGGQQAPDSGTTAMLLGSALTGLGVMRRYLKR
jgi:hypothetical protein